MLGFTVTRAVNIRDNVRAKHPNSTLSESVGGTLYATTPGGTRITYNREALLRLEQSPFAADRPTSMPDIEGSMFLFRFLKMMFYNVFN